jgi:fatty acyl-CoA reductase
MLSTLWDVVFFSAYVSGERAGLILEASYGRGDTLNGVSGLDIDEEKKLVDQKLNELQAEGATTEAIKEAMKDMGIERLVMKYFSNP